MNNIVIIGNGEIGKSLAKCYDSSYNVVIKDIEPLENPPMNVEVMNVCIPYSDGFEDIVVDYIMEMKPRVVIIHSTVIPETTNNIIEKCAVNMERVFVCHSPVRGVHPNLYEGLMTFVKYIGTDNEITAAIVADHYTKLGIKHEFVDSSTATELAKILCTTYYGTCIVWHNEVAKLCKKYKVNFDDVATNWTNTYNKGFTELGMGNVARPVLYAPKDGKIGGHCIRPNAVLCKEFFNSPILDAIIELQ